MLVFGGYYGGYNVRYDDIRVFDTETNCWANTPSAHLGPERYSHWAFAYNEELYVFGGDNLNDYTLTDLWKYNPETFAWKKVQPKGEGIGSRGYTPASYVGKCCCRVEDRVIFIPFRYKIHCKSTISHYETPDLDLFILDFSPSLKTLCKLAVIQYGLEQSGLPHNIRWELGLG